MAAACGPLLKAGRPAGHVLWQGVYERDPECGLEPLVAVLCWGGAAMRLKVILATRWKLDKATGELVIDPKTGKVEPEVRYFITSLDVGEIRTESLARDVRDQWAVVNKNPWRRDASQWREDACRLRNPCSAQRFGWLRHALLAIIPRDLGPLATVFLRYTRNPVCGSAELRVGITHALP